MKRIISLMLVLSMLPAGSTLTAFAEDTPVPSDTALTA